MGCSAPNKNSVCRDKKSLKNSKRYFSFIVSDQALCGHHIAPCLANTLVVRFWLMLHFVTFCIARQKVGSDLKTYHFFCLIIGVFFFIGGI